MNNNFDKYIKEKQKYEIMTIVGYLVVGISFILFLPISASSSGGATPFIMMSFLGGGVMAGTARSQFKKLSNEFKTKYLPNEIRKVYPDCKFSVNEGFDSYEIYNSQVLQKQDRYHSEDMIKGSYEGVNFRTADVVLKDVRRSGKSTTVVTVFQGRVYEFEFNKSFQSNILLLQPGKFRLFGGWQKVKTESIKFNSELKIYAEDEHEVFYILTPHFMEKLLMLDRKYYDKISFSFINNKLYIAIDTRIDTFDLKMFEPINNTILSEYTDQLNDIKDFIHELSLDNKLFKN